MMRTTATIAALCMSGCAYAAEYFVATDGSDAAQGTRAAPFATIQHAADLMKAGDTCYIRAGNYHGEVVIDDSTGTADSPLTFTAYGGERVVLDGSRSVQDLGSDGWTQHRGNIYKTTLTTDVWQVFVDGEWMMLARWPNARFDDGSAWTWGNWAQGDEKLSSIKQGVGREYDAAVNHDLAASGLDVSGAIAILNVCNFITYPCKVTSHAAGKNCFEYVPMHRMWLKPVFHYYFFDSKLDLLDSETEWYFDPATKTLYLWASGGGAPSGDVRGKTMTNAFFIKNSRHVRIWGLDFFATTFRLEGCDAVTVEDCNLKYPCFNRRTLGDTGKVLGTLIEKCTNTTVLNCLFSHTDGLVMCVSGGRGNTVENCELHHLDYTVAHHNANSGFIWFKNSLDGVFRRNTVYKTGASEGVMTSSGLRVELNDISDAGHLQSDGSYVHLYQGHRDVDIVRNWFHRSLKSAIRLSDGPKNVLPPPPLMRTGVARNNVSFGPTFGGTTFMVKGDERRIYNNLCKGSIVFADTSRDPSKSGIHANSVSANNAVAVSVLGGRGKPHRYVPPSGRHSNNWEGRRLNHDLREQLRDWDNLDFRPAAGSALIDAGTVIAGVTDGYLGKAPDIGAYEYGAPNYWIPGRQYPKATRPIPPDGTDSAKVDADLMWLEAYRAESHDVYFGTDREAVKNASRETAEFKKNQSNNVLSPGKLLSGQTYFWRVDAIRNGTPTKGDVWSFIVKGAR